MAATTGGGGGGRSEAQIWEQGLRPPARRKSDRLSAAENRESSVPLVKRSIVLKKIEPQKNVQKQVSGEPQQSSTFTKTIAATPRRSPRISPQAMKENVGEGSVHLESKPSDEAEQACTLPSASMTLSPSTEETGVSADTELTLPVDRSTVMFQKVRRSYSRLSPFGTHSLNASTGAASCSFGGSPCLSSDASDTSTPNQPPSSRRSFFGFERLLASEAILRVSPVKPLTPKENDEELSARATHAAASLRSLDVNIPGIAVAKEKKKKRKIPQIEKSALDEWAAQMNASFAEAERFDLLVE
ncbi:sororin isoform X1 [Carcharodon carcharias]|uniref:sororin isoform X1 n=1 Tax=Carcharodon carcharias TaxID=13397 RepID=UPI001B7F29D1|nr:sororin isoform X1 [Carcharodon carcharias]